MMLARATGYSGPQDPTNPDSIPDYDGWGPDAHWSAKDWQTWHASMVARYGKSKADDIFVQAYGAASVLEEITRARIEDKDFQTWAQSNDLLDKLIDAETGVRGYERYLYESGVAKYAPYVGLALGALLLYKIFK